MKNTLKPFVIALAIVSTTTTFAQKKEIKASESSINWTGKKVTGSHEGTLAFENGYLNFDGDKITGGEFVVDMTTLAVTDLEPGNGKEKLEGHLNSDDFFGVADHKTAKLVVNKAKKSGDTYKVMGDLTIKGKTNPITFDLKVDGATATTSLKVDRTKYDIKYGSGSFFDNLGDKAIYDDFVLDVTLKM
ncbi:YceI family protein [Aquimarina brevivitae]|uniref:Polyisoprenoid-binding protein YceI n=1 Tax=Aquimarina brevivitae TaxID=323412 RepID=A0A4Q7PHZ1_9FLAO|nr:YceI family protein [Aquimarina brevivitae]RZT00177.1 polyisoprenoid-binding protein YceI [Aquimarina brevivitae]